MQKLIIIFLIASPALLSAQNDTVSIDERLYNVFEYDFLKRMQEETPAMLEYYNFFLNHAYQIEPLHAGKESNYAEVQIDDLTTINILKVIKEQSLHRDYVHQSIYRIKNTDKLLVLISEKELVKKFNQKTGRN